MRKQKVLLVGSKAICNRRIFEDIRQLAAQTFGEAHSFVPEQEYEKGWPGACNFMLKETLFHVEHYFKDDTLLLEPDAIPVTPDWLWNIERAWKRRAKGKEFMGAFVPYDLPHMSGIGVYGRNWRSVAPKLAEVQDQRGWDTYAADQMMPHVEVTPLIQHVWFNPKIESLAIVSPDAVIFHQDKAGRLISLLDDQDFHGGADRAFGYSTISPEETLMMHYFITFNANRVIRSQGIEFYFDKQDQIGGVWHGTFATDKESEILALQALAADSNSAVREIDEAEYLELTKKKVRSLPNSTPSNAQPSPQARIVQGNAVLVDEPDRDLAATPGEKTGRIVSDIEDVIRLGKVVPFDVNKSVPRSAAKAKARKAA